MKIAGGELAIHKLRIEGGAEAVRQNIRIEQHTPWIKNWSSQKQQWERYFVDEKMMYFRPSAFTIDELSKQIGFENHTFTLFALFMYSWYFAIDLGTNNSLRISYLYNIEAWKSYVTNIFNMTKTFTVGASDGEVRFYNIRSYIFVEPKLFGFCT